MTWPRVLLFCLLTSSGLVSTASAQVSVEGGGGMRLPGGWLIGGDVVLPSGLFVGADVMFVPPDNSDSFSAYSAQGGFRFRSTVARGFQPYVVGSYGIDRNSTGNYQMFGFGGGFRYWVNSRLAPFVEYRHFIVEVNDVGRAPWLSDYGSASTVAFGVTFRPIGGRANP